MRAALFFNLPEETNDFELAQWGWEYKLVLDELDEKLRKMNKYEDIESIKITEVRKLIRDLLSERDL